MAKYDTSIIQQYADKLYSEANFVIFIWTTVGIIGGALAGGIGGAYFKYNIGISAVIAAIIFGAIGFAIGRGSSFSLKLQAQTALCQMKIEENTRKAN